MEGNGKLLALSILILFTVWSASAQCPAICNCANYHTAKEIRCNHQALPSVPPNLPADTQVLRLEYNNIASIGASDFANLVDLRRLTLYNNRISFVDPAAFRSQTKLEVLSMENNRIPGIDVRTFRGMSKLVELNLNNNLMTTIENGTFDDLVKLTELTIPQNPLESLPNGVFRSLSNLQVLDVSDVNFGTLPAAMFDGLTNLGTLKLNNITVDGNALFANEDLFTAVSKVTNLEVRKNSLTCIPASFSALSHLETLHLSGNPLSCEGLSGLGQMRILRELHMEFTEMTILKAGMFAENPNMTFLNFAESRISVVEAGAFDGLGRLEELHLFLNNLTTLPKDVFTPIPSNVQIDLSENPWNCDCNLRWLREWMVSTHTGVARYQPTCASPDHLQDRELRNLADTDYACPPESVANDTTYTVKQGDTFVVECGIVGDPSPTLHWLTPDHTELHPGTTEGPFIVDDKCTLTIIRIRDTDAGAYSCVGCNVAGTLSVRHSVSVETTGIGRPTPVIVTQKTPAVTSPAQATISSVPLTGKKDSSIFVISGIVAGLVLIVLLCVTIFLWKRAIRKTRMNDLERSLVFRNEPVTGGNCAETCTDGVAVGLPFPGSDARYAETLPSIPVGQSPFDPPPPYSTLPKDETYEQIYDQIRDEENEYERPRQPGEESPAPSCRLQHTYMSQLQRQASHLSQNSCGAPSGYERSLMLLQREVSRLSQNSGGVPSGYECSLIRDNHRRENDYCMDNGTLHRGTGLDQEMQQANPGEEFISGKSPNGNLSSTKEKVPLKDHGADAVNLDSKAKVTYQNMRRP